jgi:adenine deaminase
MEIEELLAVARGSKQADLILADAVLVDVLSGEVRRTDIAVAGGVIAGLGSGYHGRERVELKGRFVCPGFIDAHVHLESSLLRPREFARAVVPRGVTTVISNPHEIANVIGLAGIRFMLEDAEDLPLDALVTVPSCVPATPLATSGASLEPSDLEALLADPRVVGLGEVMDFEGVIAANPRLMAELKTFAGRPLDGHAPQLGGLELNAYAATGITSDHECTSVEEAREKLRAGMRIFLREGSVARNLRDLLPLVTPENERRLCLCTDDRQPFDLLAEGSIDHLVRIAIEEGIPPVTAIRMATLNPAEHFRLNDRGALVPGRRADLLVFEDLQRPQPYLVYRGGTLATFGRKTMTTGTNSHYPKTVRNTVRVDWSRVDFRLPSGKGPVRVIGIREGQLLTDTLVLEPRREKGRPVSDPDRDLLKMAVIERHHASGRMGLGLVRGIGLRRGAIAGTVAHDHHNLVVIGADDLSMETAARAVAGSGGGLAAAEGENVTALLPLPIAGLMSDEPAETVRDSLETLLGVARELGSPLSDPFMTMSFLGLEVIPSLKLTDRGLVNVGEGKIVPLFVEA